MGWNPMKSISKSFNAVKKYASDPMTCITGGVSPQLDLLEKGLQRYGADIFGNKQQEFNNSIANENNQLQKDSYNFNKNMAEKTFAINKDVTYNGSQIKSADMAKAGLNPLAGVNSSPATISASNVNSPNLSQPDNVAQTGLQKIQTIAGLAMQAKQLQSSLASSTVQNESMRFRPVIRNLLTIISKSTVFYLHNKMNGLHNYYLCLIKKLPVLPSLELLLTLLISLMIRFKICLNSLMITLLSLMTRILIILTPLLVLESIQV
ncbi:hypothetical protein [Bacteriophage N118_L5885_C67.5]|nr:hypothetical protein [Bacteriophage N118_L5885_C67.5]